MLTSALPVGTIVTTGAINYFVVTTEGSKALPRGRKERRKRMADLRKRGLV